MNFSEESSCHWKSVLQEPRGAIKNGKLEDSVMRDSLVGLGGGRCGECCAGHPGLEISLPALLVLWT